MIHQLGSAIDLFIHPGEYEFADQHFCIRTTLGSCVAIVMWHPQRQLGGMCHFMLPSRERQAGQTLNGKYADEALDLMFNKVAELGTRPKDYEVKLFGGGNMFVSSNRQPASVSARNVEAARQLIAERGLRIKSESLGGSGYRNLVFDIARGDVWVRHVDGVEARTHNKAAQ